MAWPRLRKIKNEYFLKLRYSIYFGQSLHLKFYFLSAFLYWQKIRFWYIFPLYSYIHNVISDLSFWSFPLSSPCIHKSITESHSFATGNTIARNYVLHGWMPESLTHVPTAYFLILYVYILHSQVLLNTLVASQKVIKQTLKLCKLKIVNNFY